MFPIIAIDSYLPESLVRDVSGVIRRLQEQGGKIRIVKVPVDEFQPVLERVSEKAPFGFCPTLCGVPIEFGISKAVEVVGVRDDDTNTVTNINNKVEEIAAWQQ